MTVNRWKVFIVWLDKRDQVANAKRNGKASAYRGAAVYFAVSDDQGTSFRGNHKLADHSCECCRIALLPTDNGNVIVMWRHVFAPNIRDHALAEISPDGHAGKLRRATFDDWRVDACPHHGPSLAADTDGSLHAVWFTQAPGKAGVFYGRLHNGGVGAQRRVGGETAAHADLAIIGHRVAVAWKEFDGERSQLRAMLSENGGDSWHEYELANTEGPSDQPRMFVHRKRFYVFWNTRQQPLSATPHESPIVIVFSNCTASCCAATALLIFGMASAAELRPFDAKSFEKVRASRPGKPFVLAFWSVGCAPCVEELGQWGVLQKKFPDVNIVLVAADPPDTKGIIGALLARHDLRGVETWAFADDFAERVRWSVDRTWRGEVPRTYFFDAAHQPLAHSGRLDLRRAEQWFSRQSSTLQR